jgi:hypothetical protein
MANKRDAFALVEEHRILQDQSDLDALPREALQHAVQIVRQVGLRRNKLDTERF